MPYKKIIGGIIAVIVGGWLMTRTFLSNQIFVYPIGNLLWDLPMINAESFRFVLAGIVVDLAHISVGLLVISFGFDSLRRFRKPLIIVTGAFAAVIASYIAYIVSGGY